MLVAKVRQTVNVLRITLMGLLLFILKTVVANVYNYLGYDVIS